MLGLCRLEREIKLAAVIGLWFGKGLGRERGEGKGEWQGFGEKKKKSVWVFSDDVMELAENTSLLLECKQ